MRRLIRLTCLVAPIYVGFVHTAQAQMSELPDPELYYNIQTANLDDYSAQKPLLSTDGGTLVDLFYQDDGSNRQKWQFIPIDGAGRYAIMQLRTRTLLSTDGGSLVDLFHGDDRSGRQHWILRPNQDGTFHIIQVATNTYLSTDGSRVDLFWTDDRSGRQRWRLIPEAITITSISFDESRSTVTPKPDAVVRVRDLQNLSNEVQEMSRQFSQAVEESSSFTRTHGFSVTAGVEVEAKMPLGGGGAKGSFSTTTSHEWSFGKEEKRQTTVTTQQNVKVPACHTGEATFTVRTAEVEMPYTATGITKSGRTVTSQGIWKGVQVTDASVVWGANTPIPGCSSQAGYQTQAQQGTQPGYQQQQQQAYQNQPHYGGQQNQGWQGNQQAYQQQQQQQASVQQQAQPAGPPISVNIPSYWQFQQSRCFDEKFVVNNAEVNFRYTDLANANADTQAIFNCLSQVFLNITESEPAQNVQINGLPTEMGLFSAMVNGTVPVNMILAVIQAPYQRAVIMGMFQYNNDTSADQDFERILYSVQPRF